MIGFLSVLISNGLCIFLRTVNMRHVLDGSMMKAQISGIFLAGLFLYSIIFSTHQLIKEGEWYAIAGYLIGGNLGQYFGMIINRRTK